MQIILSELIRNCNRCKVIDKPFIIYEVYEKWLPSKVRLLIIGESPPPSKKTSFFYNLSEFDRLRLSFKYILGNKSWKDEHLLSALKNSGVFVTSAVKCRPPSREAIPIMRYNCVDVLEEEVKVLNPKTILAMGKCAAKSISEIYELNEPKTLKTVTEFKLGELRLIFSPHFNYVFRFRRDLATLLKRYVI